ncbi:hypothetical protein K493DRAFT_338585 [Basidiobolus meristosporus CBS 931.73]|uniref:Virilizer N-terminal domain-containing protein n=1 Tax=Basidiobolus meristosporus CBS 931.73 TaxID=1314790 RepID=A0A1Y1Y5H4_9FUNG|nr:hypothetical protein K493DRAFT_338585 [Basidiobolus meristosporus CBS 931.73]|eukprot:ORX92864.1 hypothetical protein K493DRAFT_338585 [Basidiobolus meristosporus CBS 931.73]
MEKKTLIYFDTLKPPKHHDNKDLDYTHCIKFQKTVTLTDLVIIPHEVTPFHNNPSAERKGFTFHTLIHKKPVRCKKTTDTRGLSIFREDTSYIQPLDSFDIEYEQDIGIQGCQFDYGLEFTTRFLLVKGRFEALTLCIYGYVPNQPHSLVNMIDTGSGAVALGKYPYESLSIITSQPVYFDALENDESGFIELIRRYKPLKLHASKLNEAQVLHKKILTLTEKLHNQSIIDPLINGTLKNLWNAHSKASSSSVQPKPTNPVYPSAMGSHQKSWIELKQQVSEVAEIARRRATASPLGSEPPKLLQQLLHRINQLLEDALIFARKNGVQVEDDLANLMNVISDSMSITSGLMACQRWFCTNLKIQILEATGICMNNPLVAQYILYTGGNERTASESLYCTYISPLIYESKLPSKTLKLTKDIVEKIAFFENCAVIRDVASSIVKDIDQSRQASNHTPHDVSLDSISAEPSSIKRLTDSVQQLTAVFYAASFEQDRQFSLEASYFRYLSFHEIIKLVTNILVSSDSHSRLMREQILPSLFDLCLTLWQTKQGLVYLSNELEGSDLGNEHLFSVWIHSLISNGDPFTKPGPDPSDLLCSWFNGQELQGCPGILDYRRGWINEHEYSPTPETPSFSVDSKHTDIPKSTSISDSRWKLQFTVEEFVTVLLYQVYAVRLVSQLVAHSDLKGKRPVLISKGDYLQANQLIRLMHDMCILNVGRQAIVAVVNLLGALPSLISYSSSNLHAKKLVTTIFSFYHLLDIKLTHADFDRLRITYQQDISDDPIYSTILKYQTHNDLGVLIDILANTEKRDFLKDSVVNKLAFCIRILLKHSHAGADPLRILSSQLNIIGATQEDPILIYLLRIIEAAIENLGEVNKISSLYSDTSGDDEGLKTKRESHRSKSVKSIKKKKRWLALSLLTLELIFNIVYHSGDGLIVSVTLTEPGQKAPEDINLDITRDDHLLNKCFKQILKLFYTLDQLNIHNLRPKVQRSTSNRRFFHSHSHLLLRNNLEVIYKFFDMANVIIPDQVSEDYYEGAGEEQYRFQCKIPTDLIGNKIVQYLLDGLHDAPQHFLSGIRLLSNLLPLPLVDNQIQSEISAMNHWTSLLQRSAPNLSYSGKCLRMYWTKQLLPLKDDIEECIRTVMFTSCKEMHISLRLLIAQMVDLDIGDLGIARGIIKLLIDQLYEELEAVSHVLHSTERKPTDGDRNPSPPASLESGNSCLWQQTSFEEQFLASRIARLLCLLLSLVNMPSGHFYLLGIFECNTKDGSSQSLGMFFDIAELFGAGHIVSDLAIEVIQLLSSRWELSDRRVNPDNAKQIQSQNKMEFDLQSTQLSEIISNILGWIQNESHLGLPTRALAILSDISSSVIGTLTILSNPDFCYAINTITTETLNALAQGKQQPSILAKLTQILGVSKRLYDQWNDHAIPSQANEDIKITLFANLLGPFNACIELAQTCEEILERGGENGSDTPPLRKSLGWLMEVARLLQQESSSGQYRFDEQFDGIEACFVDLERIFQTRKRSLDDLLQSRDSVNSSVCEEFINHDDYEEMFYFSEEVQDFKAYGHRMFPGFSSRKRVKVYKEESDEEGDPVIIPFEPHHVSTLAREEPHRKNLGGGKAYQNNEFRYAYGVRKSNAARLPSVHVDEFVQKASHPESFGVPNPPAMSNQPPDNLRNAHPYEHPAFRPVETEGHQYRPRPGYPDPLTTAPMMGPRGTFQRFPNGHPPGGVPPPYYNPHFYPGVPPNQGYPYERPFFPSAPNQFFDPSQQPRPRFPMNPLHMEPGNHRFRKGPNQKPNGAGRMM